MAQHQHFYAKPAANQNAPDATKCTLVVTAASVAYGGTPVTCTVQAKNSSGTNIAIGGSTVVFTISGGTSTGSQSAVTDHGDGTYTCTFTPTLAGTAKTVSATIDGTAVSGNANPTITVTAGTIDRTVSTLTLSAPTAQEGGSAVTATLQAKDGAGNNLTAGGSTVVISHSGGTSVISISGTTDVGDGTYTASITPTTQGTATTMSATIGGQSVTTTMPTFTVTQSGFLTPDLLNGGSFENPDTDAAGNTITPHTGAAVGWSGFNGGGNNSPGVNCVRDTNHATDRSTAVKLNLPNTTGVGDHGNSMFFSMSGQDHVYSRWDMYLDARADGTLKYQIYEGGNAQFGGLYFRAGNNAGKLVWWFIENYQYSGNIVLCDLSTLVGVTTTVEIDYWRNGHPSGFPAARIWLNNVLQAPTVPVTHGLPNASIDGSGYIVAGERCNGNGNPLPSSTAQIKQWNILGVLNGGLSSAPNTVVSNIWVDRVGISTLGRVGP